MIWRPDFFSAFVLGTDLSSSYFSVTGLDTIFLGPDFTVALIDLISSPCSTTVFCYKSWSSSSSVNINFLAGSYFLIFCSAILLS